MKRLIMLVLGQLFAFSAVAGAQRSLCLPGDTLVRRTQDALIRMVTSTDSVDADARANVNLPLLKASEVQLVDDASICAKAAAALASITRDGDPRLATWVWTVGPNRYVAYNGHHVGYGPMYLVVFDQKFTTLSAFTF